MATSSIKISNTLVKQLASFSTSTTETQHSLTDSADNYNAILIIVGDASNKRGSILLKVLENCLIQYWYNSTVSYIKVVRVNATTVKVTSASEDGQSIWIYGIK